MADHIRISDPYTRNLVEEKRVQRGDKTLAKTARDLIIERITELQNREARQEPEASSAPATAAVT